MAVKRPSHFPRHGHCNGRVRNRAFYRNPYFWCTRSNAFWRLPFVVQVVMSFRVTLRCAGCTRSNAFLELPFVVQVVLGQMLLGVTLWCAGYNGPNPFWGLPFGVQVIMGQIPFGGYPLVCRL